METVIALYIFLGVKGIEPVSNNYALYPVERLATFENFALCEEEIEKLTFLSKLRKHPSSYIMKYACAPVTYTEEDK